MILGIMYRSTRIYLYCCNLDSEDILVKLKLDDGQKILKVNIFIFSILLEYFSIFHLKWVFGTLFFHFMPISQGEGLCAQKKLQPLRPPNCLLEGTGPKSSGLAYLLTIFIFAFIKIFFNSDYVLWSIS